MALPALREDLDLLPGPTLADGQPSWTLHDPARNLFFRIDWPTFEVMQRWAMDD
jgi:putative peptide zinc metalloprotease protein